VTGEVIGYARQKLLAAGALDVFSSAIQMKKDRPGTLLSVICRMEDRKRLETILFAETATFGIRRRLVERTTRQRTACQVPTPWGTVDGKLGRIGASVVFTPEYESCAALAAQFAVPLRDVYRAAEAAFAENRDSIVVKIFSASKTPPPGRQSEHDHGHSHDHGHDHDGHLDHHH
jgi:uncharacterized protein (DUF111 family)